MKTSCGIASRWAAAVESVAAMKKVCSSSFASRNADDFSTIQEKFAELQAAALSGLQEDAARRYRMNEFAVEWADFIQKVF